MGHWTGQAKRWQTNDRGHSGSGGAWSGAILLLPWGPLTQVAVMNSLLSQDAMSHGPNSKSSCPSSPPGHFPSLQRKSLLFVWQECHAPCKRNRGPQPYSLGYLCNIRVEPITNCNSNETYVILFQIYSCITYWKSRGISGVKHVFLRQYIIPRESILKNKCISTFLVSEYPLYTKQKKRERM